MRAVFSICIGERLVVDGWRLNDNGYERFADSGRLIAASGEWSALGWYVSGVLLAAGGSGWLCIGWRFGASGLCLADGV